MFTIVLYCDDCYAKILVHNKEDSIPQKHLTILATGIYKAMRKTICETFRVAIFAENLFQKN